MIRIQRRALVLLAGLLGAAVLLAGAGSAWAQSAKTVRILVGFPAGGGTDAIARTPADKHKDELGAPVIAEN